MKKQKMNKKKLLAFAIPILLVVGFGSALLTGYLSNTVKAEIEVSSPMVTGISLGYESWGGEAYPVESHNLEDWTITDEPLLISDINGGETLTLYIMSENLADVLITGFEEAIVTNPLGVTCEDFESIYVRVDSIYGDLGYGEEKELITLGGCQQVTNDPNRIQLGSPADSTWDVGETDVSEIVVTFRTNAVGTYTFTYRVIPTS